MTGLRESADVGGGAAIRRLVERDEMLQICYWYQGEGFGEQFTADAVMPFLNSEPADVSEIFERLVADGDMKRAGSSYVFTAEGKRRAGQLFHDAFADYQRGTHGECHVGCCDDERCDRDHDHEYSHGQGAKRG